MRNLCLCLLALAPALAWTQETDEPSSATGFEDAISQEDIRLLEIVADEQEIRHLAADVGALDRADLYGRLRHLVPRYEAFCRDHPDNLYAHILYGKLLYDIRHNDRALQVLLVAQQLDPTVAVVKQQIGNILAEEELPAEALNYFLEAVRLEPDVAVYHYQIGEVLHIFRDRLVELGMYTNEQLDGEMIVAFERARELEPDNRDFLFRYAESFSDISNPNWEQILEVWNEIEDDLFSDIEIQAARLHRARALAHLDRTEEARTLAESVTLPAYQQSKDEVLALLATSEDVESES